MSFMQPEVYKGSYYSVETNEGTCIIPVDVAGNVLRQSGLQMFVQGALVSPNEPAVVQVGWLCRMSAPGYLDCTEWNACATKREAIAALHDMFGEDY